MRAGVPSARSSRSARTNGVGRHSLRMSSTSPGTSIHGSADTSCAISPIGNSGARSSGPIGSLVPGCSGGCNGSGITGSTLNHALGIASSDSRNLLMCASLDDSDAAVPMLRVAQHLVERLVALEAGLARKSEHLLADRVALHLVGAAGDGVDPAVEERERGRRAGTLRLGPMRSRRPVRAPCRSGPARRRTHRARAHRRRRRRRRSPTASSGPRAVGRAPRRGSRGCAPGR